MAIYEPSHADWHKMPDVQAPLHPTRSCNVSSYTGSSSGSECDGPYATQYRRFRNLDDLLTCVYQYYLRHGFWCICSERLTYVLTIVFTIVYATLLLFYIDWVQLSRCADVNECVIFRYTGESYTTIGWISSGSFLSLCLVFMVWNVGHCALSIRRFQTIRQLFRNANLDISQLASWSDVCGHVSTVVEALCLPDVTRRLTETEITQRITRNDTFMTAFLNHSLFECHVTPIRFRQSRLTKTLAWSISLCVFTGMLKSDGTLDSTFVNAPVNLRKRLRLLGCIMAALSPFLFLFVAIYYFLKYAEHVYKNPFYIATRRWSPYARFRMGKSGELPHLTSCRVELAYKTVEVVIGKYPRHLPFIWCRFVSFILGSFVGTILVIGVVSERALLLRIGEHDLLWILAVLSSFILLVRSSSDINLQRTPQDSEDDLMNTLKAYMINYPGEWSTCSTHKVADDLSVLCPPVALFFLYELVGILTTPLYLFFSISHRANDIVEFIRTHATTVENVGVVCQCNYKQWTTP